MTDRTSETRRRWIALATLAFGVFLVMMDITVVNVALPAIREDLGFLEISIAELQWVVVAYALAFAAFLLTAGRLADIFGRRLLFLIGIGVFTAGSLGCGLASDITVLIAARILQGVGAAIVTPSSLSIIQATFPARERGTAIGIWSAIVGVGVAIGPLVGGVLADELSWRWVFLVNVPIGVLAIVASLRWIEESRDPAQQRSLDLGGLVLSTVGLFALTFALLKGNDYGWRDARTVGLLVVAVAALITFVLLERAVSRPMLQLSLFRSATFTGANATAAFVGFALLGTLFYVSVFTQQVMGYSAVEAGAALLPLTAMLLVGSPIVGRVTDRIGPRWPLTVGMALLAVGLVFWSRLGMDASFGDMLPALIVTGIGLAVVLTPLTAAALAGVPIQQAGMGAAIVNTMRQLGGALGLAVGGAISAAELRASLLEGQTRTAGFVDGYGPIMLVAAAVALLGAGVAAVTVSRRPQPAGDVAPAGRATAASTLAVPLAELVSSPATRSGSPATSSTTLTVVRGPSAGTVLELAEEPLVLGRTETGDGTLGGDPELSRRHASVSLVDGDAVLIEDLDSTNGTFVNGEKIAAPTILHPGDEVRVGATILALGSGESA